MPLVSAAKPRIVVSCAHVASGGAKSPDGKLNEEWWSRLCAIELRANMAVDFDVVLVRERLSGKRSDGTTYNPKVEVINSHNPVLAVEVHLNAAVTRDVWDSDKDGDTDELVPDPTIGGFMALHAPGSHRGHNLASRIIGGMAKELPSYRPVGAFPAKPPFIARDRIAFLEDTRCPAVLVEALHVTNLREVEFLMHADAPRIVARGIATGIRSWIADGGHR